MCKVYVDVYNIDKLRSRAKKYLLQFLPNSIGYEY